MWYYLCYNYKIKLYKLRNYIYILLAFLLLGFSQNASAQAQKKQPKEIKFFQGNLPDFETLLLDKGKPGFVYLYTNGQRDCMAMNRMLQEKEMVQYVDSNFLAYKVDVEENPMIALQYGVETLPAVILIDNFRRERDRLYNYRSAADFRKFLNQVFE
ncbi:MAG: thioredoxin [Sphingobacteriales bacterium]|nr:MAG: thioredoxin [Sphingobacteriales bacterium]